MHIVFSLQFLVLIAGLFWLFTLTYLFLKFYRYYTRITKSGSKDSLIQMLDQVVAEQKSIEEKFAILNKRCDTIEHNALLHIQKAGLLRFNPFKDTGGDQSFILALLNGKNTGVVISSLHTRSGTRWFAKKVLNGRSAEHELSADEQKALIEAQQT